MTPDPSEILLCVLENLEDEVFPRLSDERAQSVARCTSILLRHVVLRLREEPAMLEQDTAEKRALAADLSARLAGVTEPELAACALQFAAAAASAQADGAASLRDMTKENNLLKAQVEQFTKVLHGQRPLLGEKQYLDLQELVRTQLRRQLDRDVALVHGPLGSSVFPY